MPVRRPSVENIRRPGRPAREAIETAVARIRSNLQKHLRMVLSSQLAAFPPSWVANPDRPVNDAVQTLLAAVAYPLRPEDRTIRAVARLTVKAYGLGLLQQMADPKRGTHPSAWSQAQIDVLAIALASCISKEVDDAFRLA